MAKPCSEDGCDRPGAFRTRTNPTYCTDHLIEQAKEAGLEPLEEFPGRTNEYWLTRCLTCGTHAHYRFIYIAEKARTEKPCRACYWLSWNRTLNAMASKEVVGLNEVAAIAEGKGYDYLGPCSPEGPVLAGDPHRVQCRTCRRLSAERPGDIAWGCSGCTVNRKRDAPPAPGKASTLLRASGSWKADWWDHERNRDADWSTTTEKARRTIHWKCPVGHRFTASPVNLWRCPSCWEEESLQRHAAWEKLRGKTVADVPELAERWADEQDPATVPMDSSEYYRFRCTKGHRSTRRLSGVTPFSCPTCRAADTKRMLEETAEASTEDGAPPITRLHPEVASQFHPEKNPKIHLATLSPNSRRLVWWRDESCGFEWEATPASRDKRERLRCPRCATILDSLAYYYPDLAAEWSDNNPISAWHVRPTGRTPWGVPKWTCEVGHEWEVATASRISGARCPECRTAGKSQVELAHHQAFVNLFGRAQSGPMLREAAFTRARGWRPDIVLTIGQERVAIEYDGSYWHREKHDTDRRKTLDLLAAGLRVVRLREHPLRTLGLRQGDDYLELSVHATAPDPEGVARRVLEWLDS